MSAPVEVSRGGLVLIIAMVVDSVGNGLFLPLSLIFFTQLTDVPLAVLGVLISLAGTLTLPVPIWAGSLADRFGAFPLVVAAQAMQGIGYLSYVRVSEPIGIFLASGLVAVGVRLFWSSVFTAVADYADGSPSTMSKDNWFALAGMARTAGLGVGGLVTGVAFVNGSNEVYRAISGAAAGCFLVAAVAILAFVRAPKRPSETGRTGDGYRAMLRDRPFLAFTGINTVFAMTTMMLALGLPVFVLTGLDGPRWLAPAILVGNTVLLSVLAAPVVRRLVAFRRSRIVIAAAAMWSAWCFLFSILVPGELGWVIPVLIGATLLYTAADLVHAPVSMALATALSPPGLRGRYLAAFQYSFTFAGMIAPVFFTTLFDIHRSLPWIVLGVVNLLAVFGIRLLERVIPESAQRDRRR